MIVEMRTYNVQNGATAECLRIYEAEGLAIQKKVLGNLIGYFYSEIGPLNQIIHLWGFKDLNDRQQRRATLDKTPGWEKYRTKIQAMVISQETQILNCASFSPIR
jgi:NIPSNAP protein